MVGADMAEDVVTADTEEHVMMSCMKFDYLYKQLDDLRFEVSDYARESREDNAATLRLLRETPKDNAATQRLLRDLLERMPPAPPAP
jgi:hypothetical protein